MIVSEDYVLADPTSAYGWPHVVSLYRNGGNLVPGRAALTLCGWKSRTYNFAGVFQWWHASSTVCAACKKAAALGEAAP